MESLAALSLAGNVTQFIQFVCSLMKNTRKIHNSAIGPDSEHLEGVCTKLSAFNSQLKKWPQVDAGRMEGRVTIAQMQDLMDTAEACDKDCENLLKVITKLRMKSDKKRWWKSFIAAIREAWKEDEIDSLRTRIDESRGRIVLVLCALSVQNTDVSLAKLRDLEAKQTIMHHERTKRAASLQYSLGQLRHDVELIKNKIFSFDGCRIQRDIEPDEVEKLTSKVAELSLLGRSFVKENKFLATLDFHQRPIRHETIAEAHKETFSWIFKPQTVDDNDVGRCFVKWLTDGNGIFWISGKPGSGKSTLMKFIDNSEETLFYLSRWANPKKIVLIRHYFWALGSSLQRSQEGLLRSLLLDIFAQVPELIPIICKERQTELKEKSVEIGSWRLSELRITLKRVFELHCDISVKFCFLIDGLDEFEGGAFEIAKLLIDLSKISDIKLCLSSRPWNVFEDHFGQTTTQKLYVHHLTRNDIAHYARARLYEHPRWQTSEKPDMIEKLIDEITEKAQGVFLWVFLVTRMLHEGFSNDDSLSDMLKRLKSIPMDLEQFFKHILESVDPFYHKKMAGALNMTIASKDPLLLQIYSFQESEYDDPDFALKQPVQVKSQEDFVRLLETAGRRLNGWCKGLLEIRHGRVEFLHRTLRDFLFTGEMSSFLAKKSCSRLTPNVSIMKAYLAFYKCQEFRNHICKELPDLYETVRTGATDTIGNMLTYAAAAEEEGATAITATERHLDQLESVFLAVHQSGHLEAHQRWNGADKNSEMRSIYRSKLLIHGVNTYVSQKLSWDAQYFSDLYERPLCFVLDECLRDGFPSITKYYLLLETLLKYRNDPNEAVKIRYSETSATVWTRFLSQIYGFSWHDLLRWKNFPLEEGRFRRVLNNNIFSILLRYGADVNANVPPKEEDVVFRGLPFWVLWIFIPFCITFTWQESLRYREVFRLLAPYIDFKLVSFPTRHIDMTVWSLFNHWIKDYSKKDFSFSNAQQELIYEVVTKLVELDVESIFAWKEIIHNLRQIITQHQFQILLQMLGIDDPNNNNHSYDDVLTYVNKRRRIFGPEAGPSSKEA